MREKTTPNRPPLDSTVVSVIRFRYATPQDIPDIVDLVQSAYRGEPSRAGWTTEADLIDGQRIDATMLAEQTDKPQTFVLVAETDRIVGCCELTMHHAHPDTAYFGMFAISPSMQSTGTGRALMDEAEVAAVRELGANTMELVTIHLRSDVIAMYERRGFQLTGETYPFPYGDERFGTPSRDDLYLAEMRKVLRTPND